MAEAELVIKGLNALHRKLRALELKIPDEFGQALRAEAEIEMTEAKKRTPVDTGVLRASGYVSGPTREGQMVFVRLTFGGPAAPYALIVHEDPYATHKVGQWKYLESVINESAPHMVKRVAARIALTRLVG